MFSKSIGEGHGQSLVPRKSGTLLSIEDNKHEELNAMTERKMQKSVEGKKNGKRYAGYDEEKLSCEDNFIKGYHVSND